MFFYKRQKQSVPIGLFCEPCFIMYREWWFRIVKPFLICQQMQSTSVKIKSCLLACMHLPFVFPQAEHDWTELIDVVQSWSINWALMTSVGRSVTAWQQGEKLRKIPALLKKSAFSLSLSAMKLLYFRNLPFLKMTVGHENALVWHDYWLTHYCWQVETE